MKHCIKKTHLLITLLACSLLSTSAISAVPKAVLVKAEPVNPGQFIDIAHNHLKTSLVTANILFIKPSTDSTIVEQKKLANKNKPMTLTNNSVVAQ